MASLQLQLVATRRGGYVAHSGLGQLDTESSRSCEELGRCSWRREASSASDLLGWSVRCSCDRPQQQSVQGIRHDFGRYRHHPHAVDLGRSPSSVLARTCAQENVVHMECCRQGVAQKRWRGCDEAPLHPREEAHAHDGLAVQQQIVHPFDEVATLLPARDRSDGGRRQRHPRCSTRRSAAGGRGQRRGLLECISGSVGCICRVLPHSRPGPERVCGGWDRSKCPAARHLRQATRLRHQIEGGGRLGSQCWREAGGSSCVRPHSHGRRCSPGLCEGLHDLCDIGSPLRGL
mmetsp:Transcript_101268/g.325453  ORF Transcript_101268/g.325453 Transcript_101268/m.325453 type:complete len:290 (-) Transcript_101268:108-977(-)